MGTDASILFIAFRSQRCWSFRELHGDYDIKQARKDIAANSAEETCKLHETSDLRKYSDQPKNVFNGGHSLWEPADLHSNHEIAVIFIQVPLEKWESLNINWHDFKEWIREQTACPRQR